MKWDSTEYQKIIFEWLEQRILERGEKVSYVAYKLGIEKTKTSKGSTLRRAGKNGRKWTISDLCKMADYFKESPSDILTLIDNHYRRKHKS